MPLGDWAAERDSLFELTREAEEAARRSAEAQSSVALRVRMLESNMRLIEAYGSASTSTQSMVEGAVIDRHRRRINILHSNVDDRGRPFDVDTDEETDDEIRRDLLEEGFIRIDAPVGQSQQRPWYARRDLDTPEVLRFVSPEPFIPTDEEISSDEETAEAEPELESEPRPMSTARREALIAQVQREVDELQTNQSPEEHARLVGSSRRETEIFPRLRMAGVPYDQPPTAAVVPQEGELNRFRMIMEQERQQMVEEVATNNGPLGMRSEPQPDIDRAQDLEMVATHASVEGLRLPPDLIALAYDRNDGDIVNAIMNLTEQIFRRQLERELAERQAEAAVSSSGISRASRLWVRESVRRDLKALLHVVQQKLEVEQERSAAGETFPEGPYLEITDLLRDMFLCVDRI